MCIKTKIERELTIVFPDLGGPEYFAVQPPVCSHSYLHVAANDPEKSQSLSSIPLAFPLCHKEKKNGAPPTERNNRMGSPLPRMDPPSMPEGYQLEAPTTAS